MNLSRPRLKPNSVSFKINDVSNDHNYAKVEHFEVSKLLAHIILSYILLYTCKHSNYYLLGVHQIKLTKFYCVALGYLKNV